ncbi:alginate lyase family protein [Enterococcus sp. LJL90]
MKTKIKYLLIISFVACFFPVIAKATTPDFDFIKDMIEMRQSPWYETYQEVLEDVEKTKDNPTHAVENWEVPGFYANKEGHIAAKDGMEQDATKVLSNAIAYQVTRDEKYANEAIQIIDSWSMTNKKVSGSDGDLVSSYLISGMIQGASYVKDYPDWSEESQESFENWVEEVLLPIWQRRIHNQNNWGDWALFAQTTYYSYKGDVAKLQENANILKAKIESNITTDGFMPHEARGGASFWYHYFALAPMTNTAKIIYDEIGIDLLNYENEDGIGLRKAVTNIVDFASGKKSFVDWPHEYGGNNQGYVKFLTANEYPLAMVEGLADFYQDKNFETFTRPYRPIAGHINVDTGNYHHFTWQYSGLFKTNSVLLSNNSYERIEAERVSGKEKIDIENFPNKTENQILTKLDNGDYFWYNYVNFGISGMDYIDVNYTTNSNDGRLIVRKDSLNGPIISQVNLTSTGGWNNYQTTRVPIIVTNDVQNVFISVEKDSKGSAGNIDWLAFGRFDDSEEIDFSQLNKELNVFDSLTPEIYVRETWIAYENEITLGKAILTETDITQREINQKIIDIKTAYNLLETDLQFVEPLIISDEITNLSEDKAFKKNGSLHPASSQSSLSYYIDVPKTGVYKLKLRLTNSSSIVDGLSVMANSETVAKLSFPYIWNDTNEVNYLINLDEGKQVLEFASTVQNYSIFEIQLSEVQFQPINYQQQIFPIENYLSDSYSQGHILEMKTDRFNLGYLEVDTQIILPLAIEESGWYDFSVEYSYKGSLLPEIVLPSASMSLPETSDYSKYQKSEDMKIWLEKGQQMLPINFNNSGVNLREIYFVRK